MITLRFKKLMNSEYSIYLDIYKQGKRQTVFLEMRVSKNYSPLFAKHSAKRENMKILTKDAEKIRLARETLLQYELDYVRDKFSFEKKIKIDIMKEIEAIVLIKNHDTYNSMLNKLKSFVGTENSFKLDSAFLDKFQKYLVDGSLKSKSINTYMARLKIVCSEMCKQKLIQVNPFIDFKTIKAESKEKVWLTFEEIQKLSHNINVDKNTAYAFLFACFTGLRYSDINALKWEQVQSDRIVYKAIKTQKSGFIPLSKSAKDILEKRKGIDAVNVFKTLNHNHIGKDLRRWAENSKIDKYITFHTARHSFISLIIERSNGDIFTASHLAGHSDIETTKVYAHLNDSTKFKVVDLLPMIDI